MASRLLEEAIEHDDIADLGPKLEHGTLQGGKFNPLLMACEKRKVKCAMEIIRLKPEFVWEKNHDGYSPMHFCCENGLVRVVEALAKIDGLCHVGDNNSRTPLHVAAMEGNGEVVRMLVMACPESLKRLTSRQETALHLAVKRKQCGAFGVLMEEIQKHKQLDPPKQLDPAALLNLKDSEGNTLLHIATSLKQIQILELLLQPTNLPLVQVNSKNMMGFTALDLLYQNFSGKIDSDIHHLLLQAGAKEGYTLQSFEVQALSPQPPPPPAIPELPKFTEMMLSNLSSMAKSVLLAVFIFIAGAAYACLFSLTNIYPLENRQVVPVVSAEDLISASRRLPEVFHFLVLNNVTFVSSMIVIVANTWSLVSEWSLCYRVVPMFVMGGMFISYGLIVKKVMPQFWVTVGSYKISSFWVIWLYNLPMIFSMVMVCVMVKQILCTFSKLRKGMRTNRTSNNQ